MNLTQICRLYVIIAAIGVGVLGIAGCAIEEIDEVESSHLIAAESNVQLGVGYLRRGNNVVALEKLKRALMQDPDLASAHHYIAVLYGRLGEIELADKHFRRAVRLDPEDARIHNNYGQYLCARGRHGDAEQQFMIAAADPLYVGKTVVYTNAGICAARSGATEKAERHFRNALQIQPNFGPALFQMMKLSYGKENYLRARGYLQRHESGARSGPEILYWGVKVERALQNEQAAARYASRLRSEFPESSQTQEMMGN